jgi:hypothetical protein
VTRRLHGTAIALLALAGLLAACSDDTASDPGGEDVTAASEVAAGDGATDPSVVAAPETGEIDCGSVGAALDTFGFGVQTLAQLRSQDQYDLVKEGTIVFDPDSFDAAITALRPLAAIETPVGSVAESLDLYAQANELARENLVVDDPFTEARGNDLLALIEDVPSFVGNQASISYAAGEAGC